MWLRSLPRRDSELGRDDELVEAAIGMIKVEESDDARPSPARSVDVHGHAVRQVLVDCPVACHARGVDVFQLEDDPFGLLLRHPFVEP